MTWIKFVIGMGSSHDIALAYKRYIIESLLMEKETKYFVGTF
jgi:hypothetical protein